MRASVHKDRRATVKVITCSQLQGHLFAKPVVVVNSAWRKS